MRFTKTLLLALAGASMITITGPAAARSTGAMLDECANLARTYFREGGARTDMKYNGQRTDGTHANNGDIYLETRKESFACSFDRSGKKMVEFFAEGRQQNGYLQGSGEASGGSGMVRVKGVASNDVLNVRSGPGTSHGIVGALGNGDKVRKLRCEHHGGSQWCEIEMQTDMRERGWVNARYLSGSGSSSHSGSKVDHGDRIRNRCAEAVAKQVGVSANDVVVTNSLISEGTGHHVIYVGVPNAQADWICEASSNGKVLDVYYDGEG